MAAGSGDLDLLRGIAERDEAAFAEFYDRHSSRIYSLVARILGNVGETDDVLQEVFWQVWRRAEQFDPQRGTPLAWLTLIARSRALDCRRRSVRTPKAVDELPEGACDAEAPATAAREERVQRARAALANLPAEQRQAIQWAFFDGLSHSEIAERQNLPLGTVKTRIRSGMTKCRDVLVAEGWGAYA